MSRIRIVSSDERQLVPLGELARWLALFGLVVAGVALFFWLGPTVGPVLEPITPTGRLP